MEAFQESYAAVVNVDDCRRTENIPNIFGACATLFAMKTIDEE